VASSNINDLAIPRLACGSALLDVVAYARQQPILQSHGFGRLGAQIHPRFCYPMCSVEQETGSPNGFKSPQAYTPSGPSYSCNDRFHFDRLFAAAVLAGREVGEDFAQEAERGVDRDLATLDFTQAYLCSLLIRLPVLILSLCSFPIRKPGVLTSL